MATIKAVSSRCRINSILDYVTKEEKTDLQLLSGMNCSPETVYDEMQATKEVYGKTGGRTYKHFVQSFHKDENIIPEQAHEIAQVFADQCKQFQGFEVLIATHKDKKHIHTHFIVNSVSFEDGHKFRMNKNELQEMKDLSDQLCRQRGLYICEKGKTFEGAEREETTAYSKETYRLLKKAEQGEVKSYIQDIALSILDCKEQATSRQDFIQKMNERGYGVDWQDNHKYITFVDLARQEKGEKQCKVRNNKLERYYNMDFGKESMELEFERNARTAKTTAVQSERTTARIEQTEQNGTGEQLAKGSISNIERELRRIDEAVKARTSAGREEQAERRRIEQANNRRIEEERRTVTEQQRVASEHHIERNRSFER